MSTFDDINQVRSLQPGSYGDWLAGEYSRRRASQRWWSVKEFHDRKYNDIKLQYVRFAVVINGIDHGTTLKVPADTDAVVFINTAFAPLKSLAKWTVSATPNPVINVTASFGVPTSYSGNVGESQAVSPTTSGESIPKADAARTNKQQQTGRRVGMSAANALDAVMMESYSRYDDPTPTTVKAPAAIINVAQPSGRVGCLAGGVDDDDDDGDSTTVAKDLVSELEPAQKSLRSPVRNIESPVSRVNVPQYIPTLAATDSLYPKLTLDNSIPTLVARNCEIRTSHTGAPCVDISVTEHFSTLAMIMQACSIAGTKGPVKRRVGVLDGKPNTMIMFAYDNDAFTFKPANATVPLIEKITALYRRAGRDKSMCADVLRDFIDMHTIAFDEPFDSEVLSGTFGSLVRRCMVEGTSECAFGSAKDEKHITAAVHSPDDGAVTVTDPDLHSITISGDAPLGSLKVGDKQIIIVRISKPFN